MALGALAKHTPGEPDHRVPLTTTWERAADIAVPACAINGAVDAPDHLAMADRLMKLVPGGRTVTVPDAAHHPNRENPPGFNDGPTSFLVTTYGNGASIA
ncbi:alpha/beta fold hydrolase [Streptomyces sp. NPDC004008]